MITAQMRTARAGFSMIELMIGITIMGILMGLVGTNVVGYLKKAKVRSTKLNLVTLQKAIDDYHMDTNLYPEKVRDLVKKPTDMKKWEGPYLKKEEAPVDAWGEPFKYQRLENGKKPYELSSYGPAGRGAPKEEWISVWDL